MTSTPEEMISAAVSAILTEVTPTEAEILARGVVDLIGEVESFRRGGRRRNGHATLQLNLHDAKVRGHETASRRVG